MGILGRPQQSIQYILGALNTSGLPHGEIFNEKQKDIFTTAEKGVTSIKDHGE